MNVDPHKLLMSFAYGYGNSVHQQYPSYSSRYYQSSYQGNQGNYFPNFHEGQTDHLPRFGGHHGLFRGLTNPLEYNHGAPYLRHHHWGNPYAQAGTGYGYGRFQSRNDAFPMETPLRRSVQRLRSEHAVDSILNRY
jgi:hypothetical protein